MDRLAPEQRECLRLVQAGYEAKEIGVALGITTNVVNEHLRAARRVLGVTSSRQAARLLAAHEAGVPNPLVNKPFGIAAAGAGAATVRSLARGEATGDGEADQVSVATVEERSLFHDPPARPRADPWPPFADHTRWRDLLWWHKLLAVAAIAVAITLFFAGLAALMAAGLGALSRS